MSKVTLPNMIISVGFSLLVMLQQAGLLCVWLGYAVCAMQELPKVQDPKTNSLPTQIHSTQLHSAADRSAACRGQVRRARSGPGIHTLCTDLMLLQSDDPQSNNTIEHRALVQAPRCTCTALLYHRIRPLSQHLLLFCCCRNLNLCANECCASPLAC